MTEQDVWYQPPWGGPESAWITWAEALPLFDALRLRCESIRDGHGVFRLEASVFGLNPNGSVNGGLVAAVVDQVMGALSMRHVRAGFVVNTASLDVRFLRPAFAPLTLEGTIIKAGRTLVFVDVLVRDASARLASSASGTMMVVPPQPTSGAEREP